MESVVSIGLTAAHRDLSRRLQLNAINRALKFRPTLSHLVNQVRVCRIYIYMYIYMYICAYICVYIFMFNIYIYIYIYIYPEFVSFLSYSQH